MKRLAVAFAVMGLGVTALAQQRPPDQRPAQPPTFRDRVDLVQLDVSVLDKDRRPVRGLTSKDFTVFENGKPQVVAFFDPVDIPDPVPPSAPWIRDVAPDVHSNAEVPEQRLFLIAIDDAIFTGDLWALNRVKKIARSVVDRLSPSDLTAVIYSQSNQLSQDFTSDRSKILAAIEAFPKNPGVPPSLGMLYSVGLLQRASEFLGAVPNRRKTIIYIGTGVPFSVVEAATPVRATFDRSPASSLLQRDLKDRIQDMFDRAKLANVNVYMVDACGLRAPGTPCAPSADIEDYFVAVATNTGGRPVINTNDFEPGLTAIFQENASYYMLGFQSTNAARDGSRRKLEVKVNRPDVTVRTRSGYTAPDEDDPQVAARRASPLGASVAGLLPKSDLPLLVTAAPFAVRGQRNAAVAVAVGVKQPVRQTGTRTIQKVDLQVSAFNTDGKAFGTKKLTAEVGLRPGEFDSAEYEVVTRLDLKPGRYQLRVGGDIGALSTTGSVYYDVVVPDFEKAPLSLSGLVLASPSGPQPLKSVQADNLKSVLPVVPTTRRQFAGTERVAVFARAYQGGKMPPVAASVRWQIRNADDMVVLDRTQDLAASAFAGATEADLRLDVPLASLPPGAYVLTLEGHAGAASARRDVRFHVR
jgi:VWFA-related protein